MAAGRWRRGVWSGCDLCPYFSNFSASLLCGEREEEQKGVSEGGLGGGRGGGGGSGGVKA